MAAAVAVVIVCGRSEQGRKRFGGAEPKDALKKAAECGVRLVAELAELSRAGATLRWVARLFPPTKDTGRSCRDAMRCDAMRRLRTAAAAAAVA